ncbi:MAG: lipase [Bacteroides sp.]|nr:lipase [Bacteroides sp.]
MNTTLVKKTLGVLLVTAAVMTGRAQSLRPEGTWVKPNHTNIQYIGRVSLKKPDAVAFTYPGVQINARFDGTSLKMAAKPMSGYFMAQIDHGRPFKVSFNAPKDSIVTLATCLRDEVHEVRLMYVIEGYQRMPEFRGFILDEGAKPLRAPALPKRKIEFIGNSMTCGYGVESTDPKEGFSDETENHYYSYAAITARNLEAQHLVVARSGIGIYRNYGAPKTGSKDNLPSVYHDTMFGVKTEKWDFSRYTPDVVCVNLGTNDTSQNNYDRDFLENGYRNFYTMLRKHYPQAKIVFLTGSMMVGQALEHAKYAMDKVVREARIAGDKQVFRFDMSWQTGDLGYGADYHPSKWQHEKMAAELTAYLRGLMDWF